jgi:Kdo2-lipid IVA lauroyltransferase/acyltransferase
VNLSYYLIRWGGFVIAQIPLPILYGLSDLLAWIACDVVRYRRDVVMKNLQTAFPGKSQKEYRALAKGFYKNFTDIMVESFKLLARRKTLLSKRVRLKNPEILDSLKAGNRSILAVGGHYCNWEWLGISMSPLFGMRGVVTYKPLSSKVIDRLMKEIRETAGSEMVSMSQTYRTVVSSKVPVATLLVADQAPDPHNSYWTTFLHQDTPVFLGAERIARSTGHVVVFLAMRREKRGYYSVEIQLLTENPKETVEHEITELHLRALENLIIEQPSWWLWSHKRWKHKKPA